jgi:hypothetical protein
MAVIAITMTDALALRINLRVVFFIPVSSTTVLRTCPGWRGSPLRLFIVTRETHLEGGGLGEGGN